MFSALLLLTAVLQPAPPARPPTPPQAERFGGLSVDWEGASREALAQEQAAAATAVPPARTEEDARALGDRVGAIVANGDCNGGERLARDAGDFALARAVQAHCQRQSVRNLPRWASPPR